MDDWNAERKANFVGVDMRRKNQKSTLREAAAAEARRRATEQASFDAFISQPPLLPHLLRDRPSSAAASRRLRVGKVKEWVDRNRASQSVWRSHALYSEERLKEVIFSTKNLPQPSHLRAAVVVDILRGRLLGGGSSAFHKELYKELLSIVYYNSDIIPKSPTDGMPHLEHLQSSDAQPYFANITMAEESARIWESRYNKLQKAFGQSEEASKRKGEVINRAIDTWQRLLVHQCFRNWKSAVHLRKHRVRLLQKRQMRLSFNCLKSFKAEREARDLKRKLRQTEEELTRWEDAAIIHRQERMRLEKENETLKEALARAPGLRQQKKGRAASACKIQENYGT